MPLAGGGSGERVHPEASSACFSSVFVALLPGPSLDRPCLVRRRAVPSPQHRHDRLQCAELPRGREAVLDNQASRLVQTLAPHCDATRRAYTSPRRSRREARPITVSASLYPRACVLTGQSVHAPLRRREVRDRTKAAVEKFKAQWKARIAALGPGCTALETPCPRVEGGASTRSGRRSLERLMTWAARALPQGALFIPVVAAVVGWITNWIAVQVGAAVPRVPSPPVSSPRLPPPR